MEEKQENSHPAEEPKEGKGGKAEKAEEMAGNHIAADYKHKKAGVVVEQRPE